MTVAQLGVLTYGQTHLAVGQNQWYHSKVGAPPILEPILVGIGMFRGTIWILTHGHLNTANWPALTQYGTHIAEAAVLHPASSATGGYPLAKALKGNQGGTSQIGVPT